MALYKVNTSRLSFVKEKPFKYEKDMQNLVEANLKELLALVFIRSEFALNNFRIDTLAFDEETKSFVIIEYKRDKNFSVIDQGYAYLSLMLHNKAEFILEYNERLHTALKRNSVDWSQSKVLFIAPSFTEYQREAINFKDLPIELWELKQFENETVAFEKIQKTTAKESIKTISRNDESVEIVSKEVKIFTEQDHLNKVDANIQELYEQIKTRILGLDDNISSYAKKLTIGFKVDNNLFCDIVLQKKGVKIYLNLKKGELQDPKKVSLDVGDVGHWGSGAYELKISDLDDIDYLMSLIKQSLRKNKQH